MEINELRDKTFFGMIWKFLERAFAQVVALLVSIILARILDPNDYVSISIVTIFFTFANALISGGLNTALIQKKDVDQLDYSSIMCVSLFLAIVMYVSMFFCAPLIAKIYARQELIKIIRVMGIILIINSVRSIFIAYVSRSLQFKKFFFTTIFSSVTSAGIGIGLALNGFGVWALVAQQMASSVIDTTMLFFLTGVRLPFQCSLERVRQVLRYGAGIFGATVISAIYDEMIPLVIGIKFQPTDLSFYDKGKSFPSLINSACNDTLSTVLFPAMSKVQDEESLVLRFTRRFMKASSFLVFPVMIGFFCVADGFVEVVLSEKWLPSVVYIRVFCLSYLVNFIHIGNIQAIKAIGRSDIFLRLELIKKILYTITIGIFVFAAKSPVLIAGASVVNAVIATIINTYPNKKLIGYSYRYQFQDIALNFISSVIMGVFVSMVGLLSMNKLVLLCVQIIVGIVVYLVISVLLKNESLFYFLELLKRMRGGRKSENS